MTDLYQNKYRITSARLRNWDYGTSAEYFVTLCSRARICWFGEIVEPHNIDSSPQMRLSKIGQIAHEYWLKMPKHFPFVVLESFVVMPNHIHGIVVLNREDDASGETLHATSLRQKDIFMSRISPQSGTLSTMIRSYKSAVARTARQMHTDFGWQSRFHDHIIRNDKSFDRIIDYIENNPAKWLEDKLYVP